MNRNNYYMEQAGNGSDYNYYRGSVYQQGYGMGSTFRKFFKWIVPIFKQHALPTIESGLKHVSKEDLLCREYCKRLCSRKRSYYGYKRGISIYLYK